MAKKDIMYCRRNCSKSSRRNCPSAHGIDVTHLEDATEGVDWDDDATHGEDQIIGREMCIYQGRWQLIGYNKEILDVF
jgi:hypothetical protein